jgi:hypothetical protein
MSDITPKPIAAGAGVMPTMSVTATAAPPATATAAEIPAAVANLSVGTLVTGTVIERGARGLVVLRTDKGTIKLQSPIPLRQGSTVTLQIQSVGAQVQLSILSIDGNPLATPNGKVAPSAVRPDGVLKPANAEASSARLSPASGGPAQQTPLGTNATSDGAALRSAPGDRGLNARLTAGAPTGQAPAFVARPLIGPTAAAGLEALSAQQTGAPTSPSAVMAGAIPAAPTATPSSGAPAPRLTSGDRFIASFIGPPAGLTPDSPDSPGRVTTTPPQGGALPVSAAPITSAAPPPAIAGAAPAIAGAATTSSDSVMLRLVGVEPPGSTPNPTTMTNSVPRVAAAASAPPLQTIVGTIVESADAVAQSPTMPGTAAKTLISTPLGVFSLPGMAPGPVGTRLLLELLPRSDLPPAGVHRSDLAGSLVASASGRGQEWAVLRDIITATTVADPALADHLLNVTLPRVGPNFAAGLLVFVAALRQGNPRAWLGEQTIDTLQRSGHGALVDKLGDEFAALNRLAADTSPSGWQTLLVPLFDGERIQQIRMYMRRPRRKNGERGGTRFIIEAELTKLGPVQLDGLISKPQFDLVVRTRTGLPPAMRGDIIEIFGDALLATHLKGVVIFQVTADLRPGPPESDGEAGIGLIV